MGAKIPTSLANEAFSGGEKKEGSTARGGNV